jgi:hypothetical protein
MVLDAFELATQETLNSKLRSRMAILDEKDAFLHVLYHADSSKEVESEGCFGWWTRQFLIKARRNTYQKGFQPLGRKNELA